VQYKKLNSCGLEQYFSHVVLSEAAKALKPDKRIFEYAMQLNNAKAEDCIMIGDSYEADIAGAIHAGIDQVYFNPTSDVADKKATYRIHSLSEVFNIL
jgi:putative hydrolase of the HAD superfamily